jgi:hypothetical protein
MFSLHGFSSPSNLLTSNKSKGAKRISDGRLMRMDKVRFTVADKNGGRENEKRISVYWIHRDLDDVGIDRVVRVSPRRRAGRSKVLVGLS